MAGIKSFILGLALGLIATSLGVLWSLQGAGVVHIRPILCVSNCKPVTDGSPMWLALGVIVLLAGLATIGASMRSRSRRRN